MFGQRAEASGPLRVDSPDLEGGTEQTPAPVVSAGRPGRT